MVIYRERLGNIKGNDILDYLRFSDHRIKKNEKGNDILDILMFLDEKRWKRQWYSWYFDVFGSKTMKKAMIVLIFWCFWMKNKEKGNDILDCLSFGINTDRGGDTVRIDPKTKKIKNIIAFFIVFHSKTSKYQEYHCLFHRFWSKNIKISRISLPFILPSLSLYITKPFPIDYQAFPYITKPFPIYCQAFHYILPSLYL